jgi:ABC-type lipoprotein release transport system permease subunit
MRLFLRLAWRNLWRHRRRTLIVVLSIGVTMAMMMMYDGLIAGFNDAIYGNAIKVLGGNIQVHAIGYKDKVDQMPLLPLGNDQGVIDAAQKLPQVVVATRRINTGGLATNREGAFGMTITGIEPEKEQGISLIAQHVTSGKYLSASDQDVVLIGKGLAEAMDIKVGDSFTLTGRATHQQMRSRTMKVGGIYDVGMPDIEKRTIYISLNEAQTLYGLEGQSTEVVIMLKSLGQEPQVVSALTPALPGYEIDSWQTNFPELTQTIQTKSGMMNIFGVVILLISGIGILNLLLMAVFERTREIGVLAALGMKPRQISWLFIIEGGLMGLVGVAFGVLLGVLFNALLGQVGLDYSSMSGVSQFMALINGKIYPTLGLENVVQRSLTSIIIAILAALIPAREASLCEPAQALHYV